MQPNAACSVFGPAHLFSIIRRWQFRAWLETNINMCLALLNTIFPFVFGPVLTVWYIWFINQSINHPFFLISEY